MLEAYLIALIKIKQHSERKFMNETFENKNAFLNTINCENACACSSSMNNQKFESPRRRLFVRKKVKIEVFSLLGLKTDCKKELQRGSSIMPNLCQNLVIVNA